MGDGAHQGRSGKTSSGDVKSTDAGAQAPQHLPVKGGLAGERRSAGAQIQRSLKAWRTEDAKAPAAADGQDASKDEQGKGDDASEESKEAEGSTTEEAAKPEAEAEKVSPKRISAKQVGIQLKVYRSGPKLDPVQQAEQIIAKYKHSVTDSLPELNKLGLSLEQMAQVLQAAYTASGRSSYRQSHAGGIVLLSRRPGKDQAVAIIASNGQTRMGTAEITIDMTDMKAPVKGKDIK